MIRKEGLTIFYTLTYNEYLQRHIHFKLKVEHRNRRTQMEFLVC
jgi:hypothetical protein